jgi:hypothetical protein
MRALPLRRSSVHKSSLLLDSLNRPAGMNSPPLSRQGFNCPYQLDSPSQNRKSAVTNDHDSAWNQYLLEADCPKSVFSVGLGICVAVHLISFK